MLSFSPLTRKELKKRLYTRGYAAEEIGETLQKAEQFGWIDDASLAQAWVQECIRKKRNSKMWVRQKLLLRGVKRSIVEATLDSFWSESLEREILLKVLQKELAKREHQGVSFGLKERSRVFQRIARKGFPSEMVQAVMDDELGRLDQTNGVNE